MTTVCVFILIFSTLYAVEPVGCWVSAQSLPESPVYQPDKELSVDIGDSATLPCCFSTKHVGIIDFFKQPNRQKLQIMVTVYKTGSETFHHGFQRFRYQIERSSTCFNLTILNTTASDEATYHCAVMRPNIVFAEGTYLKIKVVCKETLHGNITTISTHEKTVFGLGTALGLCGLLIFCLTCFILRKKVATTENTPRKGQVCVQETEAETLNYAALQFSKRKAKDEKF
ncbi:uncharacterized protein LOC124386275 isoform X2 [Silurus meridionalis]|uniref:Uncharacterized protein n=1 Tax=Silurus meridionalis TaxID=175797 RepID=A0A8T0BIW4_SILME|nr:uncharacterized protein LOC124386275 isoform X2 [Silurus meridionalis]KAF7706974.1 hypothetical protein HF521_018192 [Silurus meridionalis]